MVATQKMVVRGRLMNPCPNVAHLLIIHKRNKSQADKHVQFSLNRVFMLFDRLEISFLSRKQKDSDYRKTDSSGDHL